MIIGITGTIGAGKGTVADYLISHEGYSHISARSLWTKELESRGLPVNRDEMTKLANELRAKNGPAFFVEQALQIAKNIEGPVVIESIRTEAEAELLKKNGGIILAVDADREIRYKRISGRGSKLDNVSFEDFVRQEKSEMENSDPNKQSVAKVMEMADYTIFNDNDMEKLCEDIALFLEAFND